MDMGVMGCRGALWKINTAPPSHKICIHMAILGLEWAPLYIYSCTTFLIQSLHITKHSSALYIGMAKVLPIIDVLGYDGQNSSFSSSPSSHSDSTPITQKGSHIST